MQQRLKATANAELVRAVYAELHQTRPTASGTPPSCWTTR